MLAKHLATRVALVSVMDSCIYCTLLQVIVNGPGKTADNFMRMKGFWLITPKHRPCDTSRSCFMSSPNTMLTPWINCSTSRYSRVHWYCRTFYYVKPKSKGADSIKVIYINIAAGLAALGHFPEGAVHFIAAGVITRGCYPLNFAQYS